MTIRKDICHFECQPAFHNLTIMLWNIEIFTGEILNHQLSTQAVLIVLLGGEASLEMDNRSRRMDRAAAYYCPAGGTFGVHSHGRGPLSALVMYFSMYEGSSTAISKEVDSINRIEDTSTESLKLRRDSYFKCLNDFRSCKSQLQQMNVPEVIKEEHSIFVDSFDQFIEGNSKAFNAINLENDTIDPASMREGLKEQKSGQEAAIAISEQITAKLLKS